MNRTFILAAGAALIMQGGAMAQSQGSGSGFLPAVPNALDIRSDSRRSVRHHDRDRSDKAEGELAGAPPQRVDPQTTRYERVASPMPAPVAPSPAPQPVVQPVDEKGRATANLVMTGGGERAGATQYSFHLDAIKPN